MGKIFGFWKYVNRVIPEIIPQNVKNEMIKLSICLDDGTIMIAAVKNAGITYTRKRMLLAKVYVLAEPQKYDPSSHTANSMNIPIYLLKIILERLRMRKYIK
jgi:hypothetical protein